MMKKRIFCFGLVLLLFSGLWSIGDGKTGRLAGRVKDEKGQAIAYANVMLKGTEYGITTDDSGKFMLINIKPGVYTVKCFLVGYAQTEIESVRISPDETKILNITLTRRAIEGSAIVVKEKEEIIKKDKSGSERTVNSPQLSSMSVSEACLAPGGISGNNRGYQYFQSVSQRNEIRCYYYPPRYNTEDYKAINPFPFYYAFDKPLSTFSIDVDNATYSNLRRQLNYSQLPDPEAVRIEEMINYFKYSYPEPKGKDPISISSETGVCPWNKDHDIVKVGVKAKALKDSEILPANLVFLVDVSGSMSDSNKLPLVKQSLKKLVNQLNPEDYIGIVTYASRAEVKLESTPVSQKVRILDAIDELYSGGSTAGGAGLSLAYEQAEKNFSRKKNNRIILCTDGDFNVGESSNESMEQLITKKRETGIFLSVLGFGMGNYKDSKMEIIADKGNGNYYYIDDLVEANRVLVTELKGTLNTVAKDVKIQVEFNPAKVRAYRLIGYENRALKDEDFKNDKVDAGEMGSDQTVTALYEIVRNNSEEKDPNAEKLKYQKKEITKEGAQSNELFTLKLRYKEPNGSDSKEIEHIVTDEYNNSNSADFNFACAVAGFGMILQKSKFREDLSYEKVINSARKALGEDKEGYRKEFISMLEKAISLDHYVPYEK